jgi:hypothetical protein
MGSDQRFPTTALLLSVLWLLAAFAVVVFCYAVGWAGLESWATRAFVTLAVVFFLGALQAGRSVVVASRLLVSFPPARTASNALALLFGVVMTVVLSMLCVGATMEAWTNSVDL